MIWSLLIYLWAGLTTAVGLWQFADISDALHRLPGGHGSDREYDLWTFVLAGVIWPAVLVIWAAAYLSRMR